MVFSIIRRHADAFKTATTLKRTRSKKSYTVRDSYTCKPTTIIEGTFT